MDAGPHVKEQIDPVSFEAWVSAFGALENVDLGVQLHGGEPLLLRPEVELYAEIARNALRPWPGSRLGSVGLVTNGTLLTAERAKRLSESGISLVVSVDGPPDVHDRFRLSAAGRASHERAMRGVEVLRSQGIKPRIITVVTEADDVLPCLEFFINEQLPHFKLNPVRPEGRGVAFTPQDARRHMEAIADQHFLVAQRIARHNREFPSRPVYEENIIRLMMKVLDPTPRHALKSYASWTLMLDDRERLWSHPGGFGVDHMRLTDGEPPTPGLLRKVLGLDGRGGRSRGAKMLDRQEETFRPCDQCPDPGWCSGFRALVKEPGDETEKFTPECTWRNSLLNRLRGWLANAPEEACLVLPGMVDDKLDTKMGSS